MWTTDLPSHEKSKSCLCDFWELVLLFLLPAGGLQKEKNLKQRRKTKRKKHEKNSRKKKSCDSELVHFPGWRTKQL